MNDARKKQKKAVAVDNDGNSSLPIPAVVVSCSALSFGNILKEFPDFLFCLFPYVSDRVIWNSIASSNKDMYEQSKTIVPPWPIYYKLPCADLWSWSPCGTRIACRHDSSNIVIVDQRRGPLRNNGHINAHDGVHIDDLKYSPNGRFLVSTGYDGFVKLWDSTGNYEQLQEWNMREEVAEVAVTNGFLPSFCISTCSEYISVSLGSCVFLKDVEGKTKSFFVDAKIITTTGFSSNGRAIFICCREHNNDLALKVWRPYHDDDDEVGLSTLWRGRSSYNAITFSNDNTMVAIHDEDQGKGTVWSIDTNHKCLTKELDFPKSTGLYFTPDGKYIICNKENGSTLWSIAEGKSTNTRICFLDNGNYRNNTKHNLSVGSISPNNRQLIIQEEGDRYITYITSYIVK